MLLDDMHSEHKRGLAECANIYVCIHIYFITFTDTLYLITYRICQNFV